MAGTNPSNRILHNPMLNWVFDLVSLLSRDEIVIPSNYRDKVLKVKKCLHNDESGLANTMLDLAMKAAQVNYTVETNNPILTEKLNNWLNNINASLVGQIPVGVKSLSKEYSRERLKGSSLCLLRSFWEKEDDFFVPNKLWFVDGEDVIVDNGKDDVVVIGDMKYYLNTGKGEKDVKLLKNNDDEYYFVQKPYSSWSTRYPEPYLIQRGIYENIEFLKILATRGQKIASRALEYLLIIKKGTESLALKGTSDTIYDEKDLTEIKNKFTSLIDSQRTERGIPSYVTNFDTDISDYIPDFSKALGDALYTPIEKRILNGLGLVEFVTTKDRREAILNPKAFIAEVESCADDFGQLLADVLRVVIRKNSSHVKYKGQIIKVHRSPITQFLTDEILDHLRSAYDRGDLSRQTYTEILGNDYEVERNRRQQELDRGDEDLMYAHVVQNTEKDPPLVPAREKKEVVKKKDVNDKELSPDKQNSPEKKQYSQATVLEMAPYKKISDLPDAVKNNMSSELQSVFMRVVNQALKDGKSETSAFKIAWSVVKKIAKKKDGKWIRKERKTKATIERIEELLDSEFDDDTEELFNAIFDEDKTIDNNEEEE